MATDLQLTIPVLLFLVLVYSKLTNLSFHQEVQESISSILTNLGFHHSSESVGAKRVEGLLFQTENTEPEHLQFDFVIFDALSENPAEKRLNRMKKHIQAMHEWWNEVLQEDEAKIYRGCNVKRMTSLSSPPQSSIFEVIRFLVICLMLRVLFFSQTVLFQSILTILSFSDSASADIKIVVGGVAIPDPDVSCIQRVILKMSLALWITFPELLYLTNMSVFAVLRWMEDLLLLFLGTTKRLRLRHFHFSLHSVGPSVDLNDFRSGIYGFRSGEGTGGDVAAFSPFQIWRSYFLQSLPTVACGDDDQKLHRRSITCKARELLDAMSHRNFLLRYCSICIWW